ncbi:ABC transporter permease subunit [Devosia sp. SL43]|uniref:ABC transporter permease subunit n=1 Tax=Devosia sp. SL43 TaxID=2806348 RepID=UPI001EEDC618|nr:ABC transporter permease subunit [Devosia sp. SL43]UJW86535.1 ABC transporter permease subunit [Devosia sp. SL43]
MRLDTFWRSSAARSALLQSAFIAAIGALVVTAVLVAQSNLRAQGLTSGFQFLWKATSWDMNFAVMPATPESPYWWYIVVGLCNTLFMGLLGLTGATVVGLAVGMARTARNPSVRLLGTIYVETFRNLPLILQLYFWYALSTNLPNPRQAIEVGGTMLTARGIYVPGLNIAYSAAVLAVAILVVGGIAIVWLSNTRKVRRMDAKQRRSRLGLTACAFLAAALGAVWWGYSAGTNIFTMPQLQGLNIRGGIRIQPEVYSLAFAISAYGGAYVGEIVRGGFKAVRPGQVEAARALGLSSWQVFWRVQMPLAFRAMLPILTNQYVWLIKATTLGIAVGFTDFFMVIASSITHSGQTLEFIFILMAGFLLVNFSLAAVLNHINRAIAIKGDQIGTGS